MLCSNCGYENPSEHRYCGMCGTPFPHRALTVPGAQSTIEFISAPVEVAASEVAAAARTLPAEAEPAVTEPIPLPFSAAEPSLPATVTQAGPVQNSSAQVETNAAFLEELAPRETLADVPQAALEPLAEAAPVLKIPSPATEPHPAWQNETPAESAEPTAPPVREPEQPVVPPAREPEPREPDIREPEPEAPEVIREPPPPPEQEPETPPPPADADVRPTVAPIRHAPQPTAPHVIVMPPPLAAETPVREVSAQDFAKIHPPPDSLPLTSPPASSGMPTFKEVWKQQVRRPSARSNRRRSATLRKTKSSKSSSPASVGLRPPKRRTSSRCAVKFP